MTDDGVRRTTAIAAWVGAAAYSSFLLAPAAGSRVPAARSFVSEIEASGQPHRELFRLSDVLGGGLILVVAVGLYSLFGPGRRVLIGTTLIGLLGAASVTDGLTRIGCAPSLDAACRAEDGTATGLLSQVLDPHTLSGLAGFLGSSLGLAALGVAVYRGAPRWGAISVILGIGAAVIGLADVALLLAGGPFGLAERVRVLVISVWLVGAGCAVVSAPAAFRPRGRPGRAASAGPAPSPGRADEPVPPLPARPGQPVPAR